MGHVTVADNSSGVVTARGMVRLSNTILASNNGAACNGQLNSEGYNVIAAIPGDCVLGGDATGNVTGVDPLLGNLQDNGGPTATHALLDGSPALEAANTSACSSADQRGAARPQGANCDVGAYEGIRGDCNADLQTDAGDISALTLEIFDDDGNNPNSVSGSDFAGDAVGCNANSDLVVDAGDVSCLVLVIFDGPGSCGALTP
jgi:hypothetical protein